MSVCRTCLATPADKQISELEKSINGAFKNSYDIMLFCLNIEVTNHSTITTNLCSYCYKKIVTFYNFKALSLKNDAYLKSLEPISPLEDQKPSVYVDENGIKQENILDADEYGPNLIEDCKREIKIEIEVENTSHEDIKENIKKEIVDISEDVVLDDEPLCVVQKVESTPEKKNAHVSKKTTPSTHLTLVKRQRKREVCEECGKSFRNIKEHALQHLPKAERPMLQCEACPKTFINIKSLKKHHKSTHLGVKSTCDVCNKEVVDLSKHKMQVHNPEQRPFGCVSCARRYCTRTELDLHKTVHTRDLKYECDICQKKFRLKNSIVLHIRGFHQKERNCPCKICGKAFFSSTSLKTHLESHSQARLYKCKGCEKSYKTMDYLRKHYRITHSDVKNYNCAFCSKSFKRSSDRNDHMLTHTTEKPYQCRQCDMTFKRSGSRRKHERAHAARLHADVTPPTSCTVASISTGNSSPPPTITAVYLPTDNATAVKYEFPPC